MSWLQYKITVSKEKEFNRDQPWDAPDVGMDKDFKAVIIIYLMKSRKIS